MINSCLLVKILLCFILITYSFTRAVNAEMPPIITVIGEEIYPIKVQDRLVSLLWELGEPEWKKEEIKRIMPPVFSYLRAFTGRQYDQTLLALQRGDKYRPMIREQLKKSRLPLALEALPMAESAYRYNARSNQGAYGLWQFMPASARRYGLQMNSTVDERKNPLLATQAALKYLKDLNKKFNRFSILLSIAAYNAGEGRIQGVVRKSGITRKQRGYSRVVHFLPKQTRGYVPEFLAATLIIKDPAFFGFPVTESQKYQFVQLSQVLSLDKLDRIIHFPRSNLNRLNPELDKLVQTPVDNFILRLPHKEADQLSQHFPESNVWQSTGGTIELTSEIDAKTELVYSVRTGNYLGGVANLFNIPIEDIRKWNNIDGNKIKAGQKIIIHTKKSLLRKIYRVRSGDSLGLISQKLGIPIDHIIFINGINGAGQLKVGNRLFYYEEQV